MFLISIDIDLLNKINQLKDKRNERMTDNNDERMTNNSNYVEKELFEDMTREEEAIMRESLILSELAPVFLLLSFGFSILSKILFQHSYKLREEFIQKVNDNPELQKKIEKLLNKITKKWNILNKKLNLVLTKGFVFLYNLALALLGIEIFIIYFGSIFYIFYILFKGIKGEIKKMFNNYQNRCQMCPCCPYNMSKSYSNLQDKCNPYNRCTTQDKCCPLDQFCPIDECYPQDDYYLYNEYDDYYDDYYDYNPYS